MLDPRTQARARIYRPFPQLRNRRIPHVQVAFELGEDVFVSRIITVKKPRTRAIVRRHLGVQLVGSEIIAVFHS